MSDEREPSRQVDDSEFMEIAKDPAQARVLRKALEQLAGGGAGEALQEMAKEVLSGRIGLRDAVNVSAYSEAITENSQHFMREWEQLPEKERHNLATEGERYMQEQQREIDDERREAQQRNNPGAGHKAARHNGSGWSAY
ncbi:hypothetical protein [Streptomyces halobius]|uniref:Excreted virulence factor EspC (Type VII ESX diderm) n=1 Tax=Streptomyces halobius TaxID=2879846 RepID=A0ABY4MFI9_9ACTN|nr:hypothetical protein [Streptomyces halobius]UQA95878.1 hypothetical protein K9S39_31995 [Streptomyces halobius]